MDLLKQQAAEQINDEAREAEQKSIDEMAQSIASDCADQMKDDIAKAEAESEELKNVAERKRDYITAVKLVLQFKDQIMKLKTWVYVDEKVKDVVAAILFMFGSTKDEVYPKRKSTLEWATLLQKIDQELFKAIMNTEHGNTFCGPRTGLKEEHKLKNILEIFTRGDALDVDKAKLIAPAFGVLFGLIEAGCNLRKDDVAERKASYLKRKEAADQAKANPDEAENAPDFTETPPWEGDDDMEE